MKLKSHTGFIFTINQTLKKDSFSEIVIIKGHLVKMKDEFDDRFDEMEMTFKPSTNKNIRYLYHVCRMGGGMNMEHLCYSKVGFFKHILIQFKYKFIPFFCKKDTIMWLLNLIVLIGGSAIIGINIYLQLNGKIK